MQNMDLHDIREDYSKQALSEADCADLPLVQLQQWLNEAMAAKVNEPTAMNVATVDANGLPSARIVLLKEVNAAGLVFFSNYHSRKGRALTAHPYAAATFFWPELERQVRVEGRVEILAAAESDTYFASRPYTSRIGAWASHQSEVIGSKNELVARAALVGARHPLQVPRPPHWGGYVVLPQRLEFWQGRPSRLHDRIQYRLQDGAWLKERLSP
jgi:pyridoxamine 5'-phosphate oxidase